MRFSASFKKKKYNSPVLGKTVWITNLSPTQASKDQEIAESGLACYSNPELQSIRDVDPMNRDSVSLLVQSVKEVFGTTSTVISSGVVGPRGVDAKKWLDETRALREENAPVGVKPEPKKRFILTNKRKNKIAKETVRELFQEQHGRK